jgi:predicted acylesterase/phospholipase RssA
MTGENRTWSAEQVRFSEDARRAARGALYYTRMLEPGYESEWAPTLLREAGRLLATVALPADDECCDKDGGTNASLCDFVGVRKKYVELKADWQTMLTLAGDPAKNEASRIRELEGKLESFIRDAVPANFWLALTYVRIPAFLHGLREHAGLLIGIGMFIGFATQLEAVWSLYRNNPIWSLGIVAVVLAVPSLLYFFARVKRSRGRTPWYDLGGRVYRDAWPHSLQPVPWRGRHPSVDATRKVMSYRLWALVLLFLLWLAIGGALIGFIALGVSDIRLTVYMITVILVGLMALGSVLDFVDIHAQAPIRRSLLIVLAAYLASIIFLPWDYAGIAVIGALFAGLFWWLRKIRYFAHIGLVYTVLALVVAAVMLSTLARRQKGAWRAVSSTEATHWPADSAIAVDLWPAGGSREDLPPVVVIAASGGGSRAAIYTAMTLEALGRDLPNVLANLQAIGSVSGGSLASAAYVASRIRNTKEDSAQRCDGSLERRVEADFIRPVLQGVFLSLQGRGQAIQSYWERCPGLGELRMSDLARAWRERFSAGDSLPPFPIPLMHSASLQRHAVVISPLAREAYGVTDIDAEARSDRNRYSLLDTSGAPTWVYYRSGVYGLQDLIPGFNPTLSEAVRASANFPFGFALVDVRTRQPLYFSPWGDERSGTQLQTVRLTDGGALSNSGLWSLYHLLKNRADTLRRRGVLLILVDAGGMPRATKPNRVLGLVSAILDKNPKGEFLHRTMLASLATTFGQCFDAVELEILPVRHWNVYTTWALDQRSVAKLDAAFKMEWKQEGETIGRKFTELADCKPTLPSRWVATSRVPLS